MDSPAISVVMPMRNAAAFAEEAVASIAQQQRVDLELLVVDDDSDDDGPRRVARLMAADPRIRLLTSPGRGIVDALNAGCEAAAGRYIARMDADDVALPGRLERQLALLEARRDVGIVGGQMDCADARGRVAWRARYPLGDEGIREMIATASPFAHPTVMFRTELFHRVGGFRGICRYAEDFDLWTRLLDHARGANLDEVLVRYRVHLGQSSLTRSRQQTLSALAVRAAHPRRVATGRDPLAEYDLVTEQVVFDLGVAADEVRCTLVESDIVVAGRARQLRELRTARRILDAAVALAESGPLPPQREAAVWEALAREALLLGHVAAHFTARAHSGGPANLGELLEPQTARARAWWERARRRARAVASEAATGGGRPRVLDPAPAEHMIEAPAPEEAAAETLDAPATLLAPEEVAAETVDAGVTAPAADPAPPLGDDWWRADLELSIWAWHAGELETGRRACERLLSGRPLPRAVAASARSNQVWYASLLADWVDGVTFAPLDVPVREGWSAFNPSVALDADGFSAVVRSANYRLDESHRYEVLDSEGVIRTENYLVALDEELHLRGARLLTPPPARTVALSDFPVRGYEDCRLFRSNRGWHALATVRDRDDEGWCQMVLLDIDGAEVVRETLLESPQARRHEKNWVPFFAGERLCLVYSWEPTVVLGLDLDSGSWEELARSAPSHLSEQTRGGTPGVALGNGWLFLVHECVWLPDGQRRYLHRFVELGPDFRVKDASRPFYFLERTIEFAAGLALDHDDLVISFGVGDARAWCAQVPLESLLESLARDRIAGPAAPDAARRHRLG